MQSVSSKIWTRVAVSISYDDNHYTTGTSTLWVYIYIYIYIYICVCVCVCVYVRVYIDGLGFKAYQILMAI